MNESFRARIGNLIEQYVCQDKGLFYNNRQKTRGFYDCYDNKGIYEIKSIKMNGKNAQRIYININNHKELCNNNGKYIIVCYNLINKDKELTSISDIQILKDYVIEAKKLNKFIKSAKTEKYSNKNQKKYIRIKIQSIIKGV